MTRKHNHGNAGPMLNNNRGSTEATIIAQTSAIAVEGRSHMREGEKNAQHRVNNVANVNDTTILPFVVESVHHRIMKRRDIKSDLSITVKVVALAKNNTLTVYSKKHAMAQHP